MTKFLRRLLLVALTLAPLATQAQTYESVPYSTGFEGLSTGSLPSGWSAIKQGVNNNVTFPCAYSYSGNTHTGSVYFEFESAASSSDTEIVALPYMQDISSLILTMWVSTSSSYPCSLEVGVLEDDSTFTSVETLNLTTFTGGSAWASNYHEYTTYLATYSGSGERIALRAIRTGSGQYTLFIDDLSVTEDNGCYPIASLSATDVDSSEISIAWVDTMNTGITYTVSYWADGGDTTTESGVTVQSYTADNLNASTTYHFVVTPNCSDGDGSPASGTFRTTCGQTTLPYSEGFEDSQALDCWTLINANSGTGRNTSGANTGSACFRFWYTSNPPITLISPKLTGGDQGVNVEFAYKNHSSYYNESFQLGYSTTSNDISAFTWLTEETTTNTTYLTYEEVLPAGTQYMAIQYTANNAYGLYIDDLVLSANNGCIHPYGLTVSDITSDGATFHWLPGADESEWALRIGSDTYSATDTNFSVSNLDPHTTYTVSVASVCNGDTTSWISTTFRTGCESNSCDVTLSLSDSYYGYPWSYGNATFHVFQYGDEIATATSAGTHQVAVCSGDSVTITYTGSYGSYVSYTILDGGNTTVASGSSVSDNATVAIIENACPNCIPPANLRAVHTATDSIVVAWDPRSNESNWLLWLNDSLIGEVNDTVYVFEDLTENTLYNIKVQSICDDSDSSNVISVNIKTNCGAITLPYTIDWENISVNGGWPDCWTLIDSYGTDPSVNNQNNHTSGGQYSMYMAANDAYNTFATSEPIPLPGDAINVSFWLKLNGSSYYQATFQAGVMTNPADTSTFTPILTITDNNNTWTEYDFNTSNMLYGDVFYVAFRYYGDYAYYNASALDDITISELSDCVRPSAAWVDTTDYYSADLSWNSANAGGYYVYYSTASQFDSTTSVFVNDTTVHLTGLLPQTTYYAWVVSACGTATSADYRQTGPFTTQTTCAPVVDVQTVNISYTAAQVSWAYDNSYGFPSNGVMITLVDNSDTNAAPIVSYSTGTMETFTGLVSGHNYTVQIRTMCQVDLQVDTAAIASVSFSTTACTMVTGSVTGTTSASSNYIPTYTYYGNTYSQTIYTSSELAGIDTIYGIAYNITTPNSGGNAARLVDIYLCDRSQADSSFSGTTYATVNSSMLVASGKTLHSDQSGWQTLLLDNMFVHNDTCNLLVVINDRTNAYGSTATFAGFSATGRALYNYRDNGNYDPTTMSSGNSTNNIPNIQFIGICDAPSCVAPMLTVNSVDSNGFSVSWVNVGESLSFAVKLNGVLQTVTSSTSYTILTLQPNTVYDLEVGAICTTSNDTMWAQTSIRTSCASMVLPYSNNFNSETIDQMVSCWTAVNSYTYSDYYGGSTTYPIITNDGTASSKALTLTANGNCMVASSAIPNNGNQGDKYHVSFDALLSSNYSSAQAGFLTDPSDASSFIPLITLTNDDNWNHYNIYSNTLNPFTTYYLAFSYNGTYSYSDYYSLTIDNVNIEFDSGCHYPTNVVATADSTTITVTWTNAGSQADFVVRYSAGSNGTYTYTAPTNASDTAITLTALQPATNYSICIGNICNNGDTLWSCTSQTTGCGIVTLPYFENFDSYAENVMPPCWVYNTSMITHFDGGLFYRSYSGNGSYIAVLPKFNFPISKCEIEFKTKLGPVSQGDAILVGTADDNGTFVEWVDTLTDPNQSRSSFVWMTYRYDGYTGLGTRIALGHIYNGGDWALIDDINVREIPTCFPPDSIVGNNLIDPDSSYFTWRDPGDVTSFQVCIDTVTADTNSISISAIDTVNGTSYLVPTGVLQGGGKYKFFIRSNCSADVSSWQILEFGSGEVIMSQSGTDTVHSCGLVVYDNGGPIAGYYASTNSSLVIYPDATSNKLQVYGGFLSFYNDGNSTLTIYDGVGESGTVLYQTSYSGPTIRYDSTITMPIATSSTGPLTIKFVGGALVNPGFELYIRCIPIASCDDPSYIQANSISSSSANISWYGNAGNYNIYYRPQGNTAWNVVSSSAENVTLTGLAAATTYEVMIRAICSSTDSSNLSSIFLFNTECDVYNITLTSPLVQDFEGSLVPPLCYQIIYDAAGNANDNPVIFDATAAHTGSQGLRFSSANTTISGSYRQTLITPQFHGDSAMVIMFYVRASSGNETFRVGYSLNSDNLADFSWQTPTTINATWMLYNLTIPASAKFAAIDYMPGSAANHLYVDDLIIAINDGNSDCGTPIVTSSSATLTSITVNFVSSNDVEAGIVSGSTWDPNTTTTTLSQQTSHTFDHLLSDNSPLQEGSTYTIGLRTLCGTDNFSDWTTLTVATLSSDCDQPTDLEAVQVGSISAIISWNGGDASQWEVNYTNGNDENSINSSSNTVTLTGLERTSTYTVKVRAICGDAYGVWSQPLQFTTHSCMTPTNLRVEQVTQTSAVLRWDSDDAALWEVAWGEYNTSLNNATHDSTTQSQYVLTGLTAGGNYSFWVRALCTETRTSDWSDRTYFSTESQQSITLSENGDFTLFPNPTDKATTLILSGTNGKVTVEIVDLNGHIVSRLETEQTQLQLDVSNLSHGAYFVRVADSAGLNLVRKLIVK